MKQAAKNGDAGAAIMLSLVLMQTGTKKEWSRGRTDLLALAEQGNARAEFVLAYAMDRGLVLPDDPDEPRKLLRRAAEHGSRCAVEALRLIQRRPDMFADRFPSGDIISQSMKLE